MFLNVLRFELQLHLKSRLFLFGSAVFFLLAFMGVASPNVQFGALGGANYNSPFAIVQTHIFMAMIGVLIGAERALGLDGNRPPEGLVFPESAIDPDKAVARLRDFGVQIEPLS